MTAGEAFGTGRPWLPVAVEHLPVSVNAQEDDNRSMLNFCRRLIAFRNAHPVVRTGALDVVEARDDYISLMRSKGATRIFCAFNLGDVEQTADLPEGNWTEAAGSPFAPIAGAGQIILPAYFACFGVEMAN